jgi:hypothetical protein
VRVAPGQIAPGFFVPGAKRRGISAASRPGWTSHAIDNRRISYLNCCTSMKDSRAGAERARMAATHRLMLHCYSLLFRGALSPKPARNGPFCKRRIVFHCY